MMHLSKKMRELNAKCWEAERLGNKELVEEIRQQMICLDKKERRELNIPDDWEF